MTRKEFIDAYMARSKIPEECRTDDGFVRDGFRRVALPCHCDSEGCEGWAMIRDDPEDIELHTRLYGTPIE